VTPTAAFTAAVGARLEELLGGVRALMAWGGGAPAWQAVVAGLVGTWLLLLGARSARAFGVAGGAAVGAAAGLVARSWLEASLGATTPLAAAVGGAAGLAVAGAAVPRVVVFAAGALPGAVLGAAIPVGGSALAGLAIGAAVLGTLALVGAGVVASAVAGGAGAALLGAALLALPGLHGITQAEGGGPFLLLGWTAVVGVAGAVLQVDRALAGRWRGGARPLTPAGGPAARSPGSAP